MIKIFRRIRQKLLSEGNLKRYLLYAIGEILLVGIGILLALQVNNWNQSRKNKIEEKEYLERIIIDLKEDLAELEETINNNELILWATIQVIEKMEGLNVRERIWWTSVYDQIENKYKDRRKMDLDRFGREVNFLQAKRDFESTKIAFQELALTGKINLIQDKDLRQSIQAHYVLVEERSSFQEFVSRAQEQYLESLVKNGIGSLNGNSFDEIIKKLINPTELYATLQNYCNFSGMCIHVLYYEDGSIKKSTENLIDKIENSLN